MFIAFGAAFEVPIVVIVLARMGIVEIEKLKAFRSYFIVLAFIIAAIITPPDVVSQLALAIPMVPAVRSRHLGRRAVHAAHPGARGPGIGLIRGQSRAAGRRRPGSAARQFGAAGAGPP